MMRIVTDLGEAQQLARARREAETLPQQIEARSEFPPIRGREITPRFEAIFVPVDVVAPLKRKKARHR